MKNTTKSEMKILKKGDVFDKKGNAKYLLKRNLSEKTAENLLNVYNKNV